MVHHLRGTALWYYKVNNNGKRHNASPGIHIIKEWGKINKIMIEDVNEKAVKRKGE